MASSRVTVYLFAGDALTRGGYGESYVERIAKVLYTGRYGLKGEVANAGRDGDTVSALLSRIDRPLHRYLPHWVILAIGSNDVWLPWLSSHSLGWRLWGQYRSLRFGQSPTTDLDQFAAAYRALIDKSRQVGANVLACTISPLGEKLSSPVNRRAARLNGVIKHVAAEAGVPVADVWQGFVEALAALPSRSGYLPGEWLFAWSDRRRLKQTVPDEVAERRRLWLTFDGIHLNSRGASLWADIVLAALARAENSARASFLEPGWRQDLSCFDQGLLHVCCTPGWEVRARQLAQLQADAFESLSFRTGAQPRFRLAVLNQVDWNHSDCPRPYPVPTAIWDGESGTVFVPESYDDRFLREWHLPHMVAGRSGWPPDLAYLGQPARATALADLIAVQELSHLFLYELRVAPADPALRRLLAAYLTQIVLHCLEDRGAAGEAGSMAGLWNAWGQLLADAGLEEGRIRLQARALYQEHGDGLVDSFTGRLGALEEQVTASLVPSQPVS
jgi:lysophospholipase L1-like esterase